MIAAVLRAFGPPGGNVVIEPHDPPAPSEDMVTVDMLAAPVNPADLNIIEGKYGELPELPAVLGNEGAGRVAAVGGGVVDLAVGDLVAVLRRGTWARRICAPAADLVKLPSGTDPAQASMLCVNPPTAFLMLKNFADLEPGDWILQNAANSAVGRCVIQLARARGLRSLNVVRRAGLAPELEALGADRVVDESHDLRGEARDLCEGRLPMLGLNAVGGASALNLANALERGGCLVTYGAMGRQPLKIPNGLLIFRDLRFAGFWLTAWKKNSEAWERGEVFSELARMIGEGKLRMAVHRSYPLGEVGLAIAEAASESRAGKVILDLAA